MSSPEQTPETAPAPEFSRPRTLEELRDGGMIRGEATAAECAALARRFELVSLDALRFEASAAPWRGGLRLTGWIEASVVQACVITLAPVPAMIREPLDRGFVPADRLPEFEPNQEYELPDDPELGEAPEEIRDPLDLGEIVAEALGLALPPWPRAEGAALDRLTATPPGAEPILDADLKPFAALAALRKNNGADEKKD